ncbi:MAG: hypothetical protein K2P14_00030 [Anaeroplasmataceae bacterium]|nr:hypothetical protein [Anaeroplasmataceae bacterium]
MQNTISKFHFLVGEIIMFCQFIEQDLKIIYASMLDGDFEENLESIGKDTFGEMVQKLEKLDYSDNKPMIVRSDYNFLKQMGKKRNHWCHNTYLEFGYIEDYLYSNEFEREFKKLKKENQQFNMVQKTLKEIRKEAYQRYRK